MRRLNILVFFTMMVASMNAQFINNGATITVQSGATLRVETNFENNGTGVITNNGTIEVMGNFTNAGTATLTPAVGLVKFIGTTNSALNTGGDALNNVEMAKTTATGTVTLAAAATINGNLNFTGTASNVVLGAFDLTLGSSSTVGTPGANGYVITNGAGSLVKRVAGNGTFNFPVGDDATDYSPVSVAFTGGGYSGTSEIRSRVLDVVHPNKPAEADSYLTRYWDIDAANITAPYAATMVGTYVSGDNVGTQARIKGASFSTPNWVFTGAATNGTSTVTGTTTNLSADFTGMNALNKLDITALLRGPMPGAGTSMTNDLQTYVPLLLPTTSPYGAPTSTYGDIGNPSGVAGPVTDWVKVEVRSDANPGTILETRSLLLQTDGSIVDVTGAVPYFKDQTQAVRVAINHRNHLSILSNTIPGGNFEGKTDTYNFTSGLAQAANDFSDPAQMVLRNSVWCMIQGDMNTDLAVDANDVPIFNTSFNNGDFDLYLLTDINMDGAVDANDVPLFNSAFNAGSYSTLINY